MLYEGQFDVELYLLYAIPEKAKSMLNQFSITFVLI